MWTKNRAWIIAGLVIGMAVPAGPASAGPQPEPVGVRPVYVTNSDSATISTFTVDVATGHPTLSGGDRAKAGNGVRQMVFTPDGRMAYASNTGDNSISVYEVGPRGRLNRLPGSAGTVPTEGINPFGTVVTPGGRTLYVAHVQSHTVAAFTINSAGRLSPLPDSPVATSVPNPRGLAVTPNGRFLYVGHGDPGAGRPTSVGAVTAFAVNGDGSLNPIGSPIRVGRFCGAMAIAPNGRHLYLVCQDTDEIHGFAIGSDGGLTSLPGSPYTVSDFPEGITAAPDGRFIYTASVGLGTNPPGKGAVSGFSVGADGALTPVPGRPLAAGVGPVGITTGPDGRFVYASTGDPNDPDNELGALSAFGVAPTGTLRPLPGSPFTTEGKGPAFNSASVLPDQGPVADFASRVNGREVAFDASASADPDGRVARYRWDFGDGTTEITTDPRITHVYPRAGTFPATLVVTDNESCSTAVIATGQAVLCNGTAAGTTEHDVVVRS